MARFREDTGTALLVAIGSFSFFAILAWIVAVLFWVALSIYALVEMIGDGRPSAVAVLLIVVLLVGTLVTLAAVGIGFVGKRLTPGKRDRD
jgi:cation transporter-like permease